MVRPAIVLPLVVATLIGPCLCCCTLARAFARPISTAGADQTSVQPAHKPACPHCRPASDAPTANVPRPPTPTHPTDPCPFCDGTALVVATAPPNVSPFVLDVPCVALLPVATADPKRSVSHESPAEYPPGWGTQAFLLDACHRLRC